MSFLKMVGVALTLIVIAASAWINFEYMTGEGSGRASLVLGIISVAFDLLKTLLPIVIAAAVAQRAWLRAAGASFFLILFVAFGFVSALGFGESNKGDRVTTREALAAELRDAERDQQAARDRLKDLPASRPAATVAAELAALKKDRLWDSSKGCTEATATASRELCKAIERLNGEAATAAEAHLLTQKADRLGNEIRRLRGRGAGADADPQASAIRRILVHLLPQTDATVIRSGVVWLFATLVEGWSAFGLFLCGVRHWEGSRDESADLHDENADGQQLAPSGTVADTITGPEPVAIANEERALRATAWALARLDFTDSNGRVRLADAFADYERVARDAGKRCLPQREFRRAVIFLVVDLDCEVWGDELRLVRLDDVTASDQTGDDVTTTVIAEPVSPILLSNQPPTERRLEDAEAAKDGAGFVVKLAP